MLTDKVQEKGDYRETILIEPPQLQDYEQINIHILKNYN